ncbi:MAG: CAP domain-containing protein [Bacteroidota bacterium]
MLPTVRLLFSLCALLVLGCGAAPQPTAQPVLRLDESAEVPRFDVPELERLVLRAVNRVRHEHQRAPLQPDTSLAAIARGHSQAMLDRAFFAHRDPDGLRAGDRARRARYAFQRLGENLFRGRLYDTVNTIRRGDHVQTVYLWHTPEDLAALVAESWMESPGHRANMLSSAYDFGGIGIATGPDFEVFVTLNLSAL